MEHRSAAGWEFSPLPLLVFVVECVPYTRDTGWNRAREDFCEAKTRLKTLFPIPSPFIHLASTIFLCIVIRCCPPKCFDWTTINENVSISRSKGLWRYTPTKATDSFIKRDPSSSPLQFFPCMEILSLFVLSIAQFSLFGVFARPKTICIPSRTFVG